MKTRRSADTPETRLGELPSRSWLGYAPLPKAARREQYRTVTLKPAVAILRFEEIEQIQRHDA